MAVQTVYRTSDRREFTDPREAAEHEDVLKAAEDLTKWVKDNLYALPPQSRSLVRDIMWQHRSELLDLLKTQA